MADGGGSSQGKTLARVRILLADDHPDMLAVVANLLGTSFDVIGMVGDGESLLDAAADLQARRFGTGHFHAASHGH